MNECCCRSKTVFGIFFNEGVNVILMSGVILSLENLVFMFVLKFAHLHLSALSSNLHILSGQSIDLECNSLHIFLGLPWIEGKCYFYRLSWLNHTRFKRMVQMIRRSIQAINTATQTHNQINTMRCH